MSSEQRMGQPVSEEEREAQAQHLLWLDRKIAEQAEEIRQHREALEEILRFSSHSYVRTVALKALGRGMGA